MEKTINNMQDDNVVVEMFKVTVEYKDYYFHQLAHAHDFMQAVLRSVSECKVTTEETFQVEYYIGERPKVKLEQVTISANEATALRKMEEKLNKESNNEEAPF